MGPYEQSTRCLLWTEKGFVVNVEKVVMAALLVLLNTAVIGSLVAAFVFGGVPAGGLALIGWGMAFGFVGAIASD